METLIDGTAYGNLFYRIAIPYVAGGGGAAQLLWDILTVLPWGLLAVLGFYPAWDVDKRIEDMVRIVITYI